MSLTMENKVAIVTGGGGGIGRAAALIYAREGARVVIADVNADGGNAVAQEVRAAGGEALFVRCDVSKEAEVAGLVEAAIAAFGKLDCAFNNAGIGCEPKPLVEHTAEHWQKIYEVDLLSIFLCMKHQIPEIIKAGGGAIVNVSSNAGVKGIGSLTPYAAAKAGIIGLSRTAAVEYAAAGVRINTLSPGLITVKATHDRDWAKELRIPMARVGKFEEVAEVAVFLSSSRASYVTGQLICVDGGQTAG